jgi:hypothetical protein
MAAMTSTATQWRPRACDVPDWRAALAEAWQPGGVYTRLAPVLDQASNGGQHFVPDWEHDTARMAALWYVGGQMCELLAAASPDLPDTVLHPGLVPDVEGLVIFEEPLVGIDADNLNLGPVHVGAMMWGRALWARDGSPILGVTVYGPLRYRPWLAPLGGLIWPFGRSMDDALSTDEWGGDNLTPVQAASMAEDRRRLLGLWLLSTQTSLATSIRGPQGRAPTRRAQRAGLDPLVRVVQLRTRPSGGGEGITAADGRVYRHRWTVSGHWRNQAHGHRYSEHRPVYINPYLKGPEDAPLLTTPRVKVWTR